MARINDGSSTTTGPGGGTTFWTDNAPPQAGPNDQAITDAYQQYLGRVPSAQELQSHAGNPGGLTAVLDLIKNSAEARTYAASRAGVAQAKPSAQEFIKNWQASHPVSEGIAGLTAALKAAGYTNVSPYMYGNTPSGNELTIDGQKFKVLSGENSANPSWYTGGNDSPGGGSSGGGGGTPGDPALAGAVPPNFGAPPPVYTSNPNAPTVPVPAARLDPYVAPVYAGDLPLPTRPAYLDNPYVVEKWHGDFTAPTKPTDLQTEFRAPTQAELEASPGYLARLKAGQQVRERSAAARGSILSGGTQVGLERFGQDYASNEYGNLYGQGLTTRQQNVGEYNTGFTNAFDAYLQKYKQFTDSVGFGLNERQQNVGEYQTTLGNAIAANANRYGQFVGAANMGLAARQQNVGEANTAAQAAQTAYQNQYAAWLGGNARTLSDYLTNTQATRNTQTDYWNRLNDLANRGLTGAINSRVA